MSDTPDRLPPLNALRAFEAAARRLSFTQAAEELNVTPGAISQQIRQLEDFAGTPLFKRTGRSVLLTDAAQASLPLVREAFERIAEAAASCRPLPARAGSWFPAPPLSPPNGWPQDSRNFTGRMKASRHGFPPTCR